MISFLYVDADIQEYHLADLALFAQRCVDLSDLLHTASFVNTLSPCIRGVIAVV